MYSKENEAVCGLCVNAEIAKGIETHIFCKNRNEYIAKSKDGCKDYKYDIFKRKVSRKKDIALSGFSPEDFKL